MLGTRVPELGKFCFTLKWLSMYTVKLINKAIYLSAIKTKTRDYATVYNICYLIKNDLSAKKGFFKLQLPGGEIGDELVRNFYSLDMLFA